MKIMFLIYSLGGGGAERVTSTLANRFVEMGHQVEIALLDGAIPPAYPLSDAIRLRELHLAGPSESGLHAIAQLIHRVRAIRRHLRESKPDVAIGMMTASAVLLALARPGLPLCIIGSERVYPPAFPLNRSWTQLRRWAYGLLDCLVVQTEATRRWAETRTRARHVAVIANPVAPRAAMAAESVRESGGHGERHTILAVGRLVEQKGFERLIAAFARVAAHNPQWDLVILGQGPLREALTAQARAAALDDRVKLPGNVSDPTQWYRTADIFVLSSHFEGMPNVLLEAMSHGLACVAFDIESGTREFVEDGVDAVLLSEDGGDALAPALAALMRDPSLRHRLGAAASVSMERYAPDRIASQWLDLMTACKK